ncbi:MAG: hypothetical protein WC756_17750 [Taibaiella sp.]|jgi:hypothetical protein
MKCTGGLLPRPILSCDGLIDVNGNPLKSEPPKEVPVKMAMVNEKTGEILEVVKELSPGEEKQRAEIMKKMQAYAIKYKKSHPNTTPERLKKIVCKKFNVKLT